MPTTLPVSVPGPPRDASVSASAVASRVRRAFSLSGVVPLGVFLVVHLAVNARALAGSAAFEASTRFFRSSPVSVVLPLVEALFVFAPLLFHGALGLWLVIARKTLEPAPPYARWARLGMRITGVGALAFLVVHLPALRFHSPGVHLGGGELATLLDASLSTTSRGVPWWGLAYLVGTACVSFHFAAGLWGFVAMTRAVRPSAARRTRAAWGAMGLGLVLWLGFADVVVFRATGSPLFGAAPADVSPTTACPPP
jgi:succinate dehydrogenase / fumarate reductase cytochrome b subunit